MTIIKNTSCDIQKLKLPNGIHRKRNYNSRIPRTAWIKNSDIKLKVYYPGNFKSTKCLAMWEFKICLGCFNLSELHVPDSIAAISHSVRRRRLIFLCSQNLWLQYDVVFFPNRNLQNLPPNTLLVLSFTTCENEGHNSRSLSSITNSSSWKAMSPPYQKPTLLTSAVAR